MEERGSKIKKSKIFKHIPETFSSLRKIPSSIHFPVTGRPSELAVTAGPFSKGQSGVRNVLHRRIRTVYFFCFFLIYIYFLCLKYKKSLSRHVVQGVT